MTQRSAAPPSIAKLSGKRVLDFFPELCTRHKNLNSITFVTYGKWLGLERRLEGSLHSKDNARLKRIFQEIDIPGWIPAVWIAVKSGQMLHAIGDSLLMHPRDPLAKKIIIRRDEISADKLSSIISKLPEGRGLAVCSRVSLSSGRTMHIPMADLLLPVSDQNARAACELLAAMGQSEGILVRSGQSYHFYGMSLLPPQQWLRFMANALLLSPITDPRYIAHRVLDGECHLKVASPSDHVVPTVSNILWTS